MLAELPPRKERFVSEYLTDWNGARASRAAGYSPKAAKEQASRLLTKANVQALIQARCRETEARLEIARDDCIRGLQAAFEKAKEKGDAMAMISAMREIGRMLGYYGGVCSTHSRTGQGTGQGSSLRTEQLPDRELLAMSGGLGPDIKGAGTLTILLPFLHHGDTPEVLFFEVLRFRYF